MMKLRFLTAGESHGPGLTAILEGIPAGLPLSPEMINEQLARRQAGFGAGPRMKLEQDTVTILGGVMDGQTTGTPLALYVENRDHARWRGKAIEPLTLPRPGHADLTGAIKYGYKDFRPALERASARETAARVAAGAVCRHFLAQFDIQIGGYVAAIGEIQANLENIPLAERPGLAEASPVRCPDPRAGEDMIARIQAAMQERDTLGGILEVFAVHVPPGLGSYAQWDQRLEARIGAAILSIPAIKGVEIGPAFENARLPGTQAQDAIYLEGGNLVRSPKNAFYGARSGGTEGGISNGEPLLVRAAMKPIATTLTPQATVDLAAGQQAPMRYERSDFCPVPRAVPILEAMLALILADAVLEKVGGDSMAEIKPRFETLRQGRLSDLPMDNHPHIFWPAP
jgi:chorismate synthase